VGGDLAGTIEAVGSDVEEFQPGDRGVRHRGSVPGPSTRPHASLAWCASRPTCPSRRRRPCPIAATTALQALRDHGQVQPGTEGPDQRGVRWCRHVLRAAREVLRRGGEPRLSTRGTWRRSARSAPTTSSTNAGGLHATR
jgi:hypothetical protein